MAVAAKQFTSWSISRFNTYTQCPLKAANQLRKVPTYTPKSSALERGNDIHKLAEHYLKGALPRIPKELKLAEAEFKRLRAMRIKHPQRVLVEEQSARRADWTPTTWDDWTGCWVRIKIDVAHLEEPKDGGPVAIVTDWKTGKHHPGNLEEYTQQLDLYALDALLRWQTLIPHGLVVRPRLVYLDTPIIVEPRTYTGADLVPLQKAWAKRVKPMLNDKRFAPKPNKFCGWCEYGVSKGGTCRFG